MLCLWGEKEGFAEQGGRTPLDIWRDWCDGPVSGAGVASGHSVPKEAPDAVIESLMPFLAEKVGP